MEFLRNYWPFIVVILMIVAVLNLLRMFAGVKKLPYRARAKIMTAAEVKFYRALQKAVQDDYVIFAMVRVADLLVVAEGTQNYRGWLNKILSKHIDFVLCDPGSLEPKVAIELDDATHQRPDRQERDAFLEHAFESAGVPLLRIQVASGYEAKPLRQAIDGAK